MYCRRQQKKPGRVRQGGCGPVFFVLTGLAILAGAAGIVSGEEERAARSGCATEEQTPQTSTVNPAPPGSAKSSSGHSAGAKKKKKSAAARRPLAPEPARIREIQQALAKEGYYQGEPTGKWDEASIAAMKDFQAAKGLPATGKLEALSLQKLGLGSPVAGVAPPEPRAAAGDGQPEKTKPPQ